MLTLPSPWFAGLLRNCHTFSTNKCHSSVGAMLRSADCLEINQSQSWCLSKSHPSSASRSMTISWQSQVEHFELSRVAYERSFIAGFSRDSMFSKICEYLIWRASQTSPQGWDILDSLWHGTWRATDGLNDGLQVLSVPPWPKTWMTDSRDADAKTTLSGRLAKLTRHTVRSFGHFFNLGHTVQSYFSHSSVTLWMEEILHYLGVESLYGCWSK